MTATAPAERLSLAALGDRAWIAYDALKDAYRSSRAELTPATRLAEYRFGTSVAAWVDEVPCPTCGAVRKMCSFGRLPGRDRIQGAYPIWLPEKEMAIWHSRRLWDAQHPRGDARSLLYAAGY